MNDDYRPVTPGEWNALFAHVMWMELEPKPRWRPGWGCLAALVVSCVLWSAILVPLILWGPL